MAKIRYIKDENEEIVLPVTHERGVVDSQGTNLETKLAGKQATLTFDNAPTQNSNNPVKSGGVYTALAWKQDLLESGTNIKTVNNTSLLGSGNITIEGGGTEIDTVTVTVDSNTGLPSAEGSVSGSTLALSFHNLKGGQGNTGSSVAYPYELVNNLTTADATKGLSANMGKELDDKISSLALTVKSNVTALMNAMANMAFISQRPSLDWGALDASIITDFSDPEGATLTDNSVGGMISVGSTYSGLLTPNEGYTLSNVVVSMTGGGTITYDSQTGAIASASVTGDITISLTATFDFTDIGYSDDLVFALDGKHKGSNSNAWTDLIGGEVFANHGADANTLGWTFNGSAYMGGWDETELDFDPSTCTIEVAYKPTGYDSSRTSNICHLATQTDKPISCIYACEVVDGWVNGCYASGTQNVWRISWASGSAVLALSGARAYKNGIALSSLGANHWSGNRQGRYIGTTSNYNSSTFSPNGYFMGDIYAIRIYNRQLTAEEILADQALDNTRFNLGLSL